MVSAHEYRFADHEAHEHGNESEVDAGDDLKPIVEKSTGYCRTEAEAERAAKASHPA